MALYATRMILRWTGVLSDTMDDILIGGCLLLGWISIYGKEKKPQ